MKKRCFIFLLAALLFSSCQAVDLNAPVPVFETGIDSDAWVIIPAGSFFGGQAAEEITIPYDYEIMLTDVTVAQYAAFINDALASGDVTLVENTITGFYPGDEFHAARHEERVDAKDYLFITLDDPSLRLAYDHATFKPMVGYENHPMTSVSWFGAWGYCGYQQWRLPNEMEWEKAARGMDDRPFPWGEELAPGQANFYASRDPFEDMHTLGSRTTPVGFYNGRTYNGYQTIHATSPYGLYDMAGNVWQWVGDVYEGQHYRYMRGGSKDTYEYNLRVWTRNNATPTYTSPGVGFRCARDVTLPQP